MKVALNVKELINALSGIDNKDLEVWMKDADGFVHPCSRADYDPQRDCIVLDEDMPSAKALIDRLRKK